MHETTNVAEQPDTDRVSEDREPVASSDGMGLVCVGASSWANPTLLKYSNFYPPSVRTPAERLRFYADRFPIVEVDSTYYRLPSEQMVAAWNQRTPTDFIFNIKAFRAFTLHPTPPGALPADVRDTLHQTAELKANLYWHRLPAGMRVDLWQRFRRALQPLAEAGKLGAILFQLPPWIHLSDERGQHLLAARQALPEHRLAIEFCDVSWVSSKNLERTTEFLSHTLETHVIFNNAYADYALRNARQFMELLARAGLLVKRAGAVETAESC